MRRLVIAMVLAAAACTQAPQTYRDLERLGRDYQRDASQAPQAPQETPAQDTCGASRFRDLVGTPADQLDRSRLPPGTRVIRMGDMVTMDFNALRLNVRIGGDGKVASLECF